MGRIVIGIGGYIRQFVFIQNYMKKDLRNRRSTSSCTNYSQHSISGTNLDQNEHQSKDIKDKKTDYSEVQRQYLQLYSEIKSYAVGDAGLPEKSILFKWKQFLKMAIQQNREFFKAINHNLQALRTTASQMEWTKSEELRQQKQAHLEQLKQKQNETNKKLIEITSEFNRKQQQYKQALSKFIETLHQSQTNWSKSYAQMALKVKKAQQFLRRTSTSSDPHHNENYQYQYQSQSQSQSQYHYAGPAHDESIASINLSCDQLGVYMPVKLQSKRNTIDISSIEEIQEGENGGVGVEQQEMRLEDILDQLIRWGFFNQKNQNNIKKLISLTKHMQQPEQLPQQPIFPLLIQSIKLCLSIDDDSQSLTNSYCQKQNNQFQTNENRTTPNYEQRYYNKRPQIITTPTTIIDRN